MRRTRRYVLIAAGAGIAALVIAAVHLLTSLPLPVALYADAMFGLSWLVTAALLLRSGRGPKDAPGSARHSMGSDPLARSHWSRHGH
ncbi:hypothetical protein [Streptomyces sp. R44]|uniref:Uncharacterized protein n=1 Tax=Streptomyces sp. R44 TaxID=3238633 RepID=A0AB39T6U4_9ACTN